VKTKFEGGIAFALENYMVRKAKNRLCAHLCTAIALFATATTTASSAQFYLDTEGGRVSAGNNTVRIPLEGGTRFSLTDELKSDPAAYWRVRVGRRSGKSDVSVLAAPLTLRSYGRLDRAVNFAGSSFPGGVPVEAVYRFDSYRIRYLYEFYHRNALLMRWGGALKLRHAGITLTGGGTSAESRNTGFVPLASFSAEYALRPGWLLLLDADALGAPQGRAEDVMLAVGRVVSKDLRLRVGYRFLEGGSGAGDVYTFALLHYLLAGVNWEF